MDSHLQEAVAKLDPARPDYRILVAHQEWIDFDEPVQVVCERVRTGAGYDVPVIRKGEVTGLFSRGLLAKVLGSKVGFALFGRKPISSLQLEALTAIQDSCELTPLLEAIFAREPARFHQDVALLDSDGRYIGMIPVKAFALLQTRLLSERLEELAIARDQALSSARAKSRFMSNMSHELRTPLNGIIGFADLLLLDAEDDPQQKESLETIKSSGESLLKILSDVLEFSSLENHRVSPVPLPFIPANILDEVIHLFRPEAELKGLKLRAEVATGVRREIVGDRIRTRQLLTILVGNALKFTQHGGIVLRLATDPARPQQLCFEVEDTGIGIGPDQISHLFESFAQADDSATRPFGGTGLGLAIARHLAELLGGKVGVRSQPGQGTVFWFTCPATAPDAQVASRLAA
jgi:signal transduction histidine kinase